MTAPGCSRVNAAYPQGLLDQPFYGWVAMVVITRIKDGKIVEAWNHFDFMRMYEQLEVI